MVMQFGVLQNSVQVSRSVLDPTLALWSVGTRFEVKKPPQLVRRCESLAVFLPVQLQKLVPSMWNVAMTYL
jgi:hypothetical protein